MQTHTRLLTVSTLLLSCTTTAAIEINTTQQLGDGWSKQADLLDLEGDGDLDIVIGSGNVGQRLWLNDGSGQFSNSGLSLGTDEGIYGVHTLVTDPDQDGDMDVILYNQDALYYRNDNGTLSLATTFDVAGENSWAFGDVDGDGYLDAVVHSGSDLSPSLWVWLGSQSGFAAATLETADADMRVDNMLEPGASTFTFIPSETAGEPDQLVIGYETYEVDATTSYDGGFEIRRYDTNSQSWTQVGKWRDTGANIIDIRVVDINADGRKDIVAAHDAWGVAPADNHSVWLGTDTGFTAGSQLFPAHDLDVADMDGDGKLDVVTVAVGNINYFQGSGDGSFADAVDLSVCQTTYSGVAVGDLNDDGKPDLVTATTVVGQGDQPQDLVYLQDATTSACGDDSVPEEDDGDSTSEQGDDDSSGGGGAGSLISLMGLLPLWATRRKRCLLTAARQ